MYRYLKIILVFLSSASLLSAEEPEVKPEIRTAFKLLLAKKTPTTAEQKQLAFILMEEFSGVRDLLRDVHRAGVGATSEKAGEIITELEQGRGQSKIYGATLGWHITLEDQKFKTLPLIIKVDNGSRAASAGLLPGDVIDQCEGKSLKSDDSRNRLLLFLNQWPTSESLELQIRRSTVPDPSHKGSKKAKKKITLITKK